MDVVGSLWLRVCNKILSSNQLKWLPKLFTGRGGLGKT